MEIKSASHEEFLQKFLDFADFKIVKSTKPHDNYVDMFDEQMESVECVISTKVTQNDVLVSLVFDSQLGKSLYDELETTKQNSVNSRIASYGVVTWGTSDSNPSYIQVRKPISDFSEESEIFNWYKDLVLKFYECFMLVYSVEYHVRGTIQKANAVDYETGWYGKINGILLLLMIVLLYYVVFTGISIGGVVGYAQFFLSILCLAVVVVSLVFGLIAKVKMEKNKEVIAKIAHIRYDKSECDKTLDKLKGVSSTGNEYWGVVSKRELNDFPDELKTVVDEQQLKSMINNYSWKYGKDGAIVVFGETNRLYLPYGEYRIGETLWEYYDVWHSDGRRKDGGYYEKQRRISCLRCRIEKGSVSSYMEAPYNRENESFVLYGGPQSKVNSFMTKMTRKKELLLRSENDLFSSFVDVEPKYLFFYKCCKGLGPGLCMLLLSSFFVLFGYLLKSSRLSDIASMGDAAYYQCSSCEKLYGLDWFEGGKKYKCPECGFICPDCKVHCVFSDDECKKCESKLENGYYKFSFDTHEWKHLEK